MNAREIRYVGYIVFMVVFLIMLLLTTGGCQTPSKYTFETKKEDGTWTKATAKLAPKDLKGGVLFMFGADGSLTLQAGDITTTPDPYAKLMSDALKTAVPGYLCKQNPIFCTNGE